jgi:hypothetical protein
MAGIGVGRLLCEITRAEAVLPRNADGKISNHIPLENMPMTIAKIYHPFQQ